MLLFKNLGDLHLEGNPCVLRRVSGFEVEGRNLDLHRFLCVMTDQFGQGFPYGHLDLSG